MSKITKFSGIIGALALVVLDIYIIINAFSLSGIDVFESIINNILPCGLLLGSLALYTIYNGIGKKALSVTTLIIFAIVAFIRFITVILYVLERIYATYLPPMVLADYLDFGKFVAVGILAVAVVFLMLYLTKGKFSKTALTLCGTASAILCIVFLFNIYSLVTEAVSLSSGILEVAVSFFNDGLAQDVIFILAYLSVFWVITTIVKNKEKAHK